MRRASGPKDFSKSANVIQSHTVIQQQNLAKATRTINDKINEWLDREIFLTLTLSAKPLPDDLSFQWNESPLPPYRTGMHAAPRLLQFTLKEAITLHVNYDSLSFVSNAPASTICWNMSFMVSLKSMYSIPSTS